MNTRRFAAAVLCLLGCAAFVSAEDKMLFDFEGADALAAFSPLKLDDAKLPSAGEPAAKIALTTEGATSGKQALKITFAGGHFPAVTAACPVADWTRYRGFKADVTASRTCLVIFRVLNETSKRGSAYNEGTSRWEKAARVEKGTQTVVAFAPTKYSKVVTFEIYMLDPADGESIIVDNIRLTSVRPDAETPFYQSKEASPVEYRVAGSDLVAKDVNDLADKLKADWKAPADLSPEEVEAAFRARFAELKKTHPNAVLVILRDGQKGYDPSVPEKVFAGWQDAGTYAHPPMGLTMACFANHGATARIEVWSRIRPAFMRVDFSSIPKNANVLAAELSLTRWPGWPRKDWTEKPTCFVVRPCNRPWVEKEVTVFRYAKGKLWNRYAGVSGAGDDPDSAPVYLAHAPSGGKTTTWDFTNAVKYWATDGHENHGFMMYCAGKYVDYLYVHSRENPKVENRPVVMVIYEPKP